MSVLNESLREQLSIIMAALTKAAVAEICEVVDEGYAVLQLEVQRSHQENRDLRKKLLLIESIVARSGQSAEDTAGAKEAQRPEPPQLQPDTERGEAAASSGGAPVEEPEEVNLRRP